MSQGHVCPSAGIPQSTNILSIERVTESNVVVCTSLSNQSLVYAYEEREWVPSDLPTNGPREVIFHAGMRPPNASPDATFKTFTSWHLGGTPVPHHAVVFGAASVPLLTGPPRTARMRKLYWRQVHPCHAIMLCIHSLAECGLFISTIGQKKLIRIPDDDAARIMDEIKSLMTEGNGLSQYMDCFLTLPGRCFTERAVRAFSRYQKCVETTLCEVLIDRRFGFYRHRSPSMDEEQECLICLEMAVPSTWRCAGERCNTRICADCVAHTRGLCPICDRRYMQANFECGWCGNSRKMKHSGHPCVVCRDPTLCTECFNSFKQCLSCERRLSIT